MDFRTLGLTLRGHHLYYGVDHGALRYWPDSVKRLIVRVWNRVACDVLGHGFIFDGGCTSCCRRV